MAWMKRQTGQYQRIVLNNWVLLAPSSTPVQSPRFLPVKDTSIVMAGPSLHQARATSGRSSTRPFKGLTKRKNRKEQINELCALAAALTQQIQLLKSPPVSSSITSAGEQQHPWERIATRRHKLRLKAEEQNAALLRIKKIQQREIKNFKRMFRRRIDEELLGNRLLLRRPKHVHELVDNSRIFADLLRHSDKLYASVDEIFQEKGMDKVPCPGRTCQIPQHSTTGTLAEFLEKNLVPFSVQQAARAVWRCLRRRKIPDADHVYAEDYQQNEDTTTSYVHFVCSVGGTVAYIQEHGAARKFVEENRTMIVSQMTSEPAGKEIGSFGGLRYREEMSVVVRCGAPLASGQETAIIETYLVVFQSDQGSQAAMAFRAPGILDLAIKGWDSKVALRKQEIENLLFI